MNRKHFYYMKKNIGHIDFKALKNHFKIREQKVNFIYVSSCFDC